REYRANHRRAVAGLSTGGYGALMYSARHQGVFRFAASFSGYGSALLPGVPEILMNGLPGSGLEKFRMWGSPTINRNIWLEHDPIHQAEKLRGTPLFISSARNGSKGPLDPPTAQAIDPAEAFIWYTMEPLLARLAELDIPVNTHIYDKGTHSWVYWEDGLHRAWPLIMDAIKAT
ncbi:MAG: alpha/beta hydrolase-fold protein, partial [Streptosporangiaceae bacterium]